MTETPIQPKLSSSPEANLQYKTAMELKAKGQTDAALTWFRRSVINDPTFFSAYMEIGALCKEKAKNNKMFFRHAFEAFQHAARLDLTHPEAHNQYIMAGQQMGLLEDLHHAYGEWAKQFPDNDLIQKSNKNIVALSMAMMPQQIRIASTPASGPMRKLIFVVSILALLGGIGVMLAPPFLLKAGKIKKEQVASIIKLGLLVETLGMGGFVVRARIN